MKKKTRELLGIYTFCVVIAIFFTISYLPDNIETLPIIDQIKILWIIFTGLVSCFLCFGFVVCEEPKNKRSKSK